jgi:flagellar assembly factor FliW
MSQETDEKLEDKVVHFPDGLPGFPDLERFVVVELRDDGAFQQLQSVDDPDISMIVCVPWLFFPDYAPVLSDAEQEELEIESASDAVVFVPVSFDAASRQASLNLLGPFVVNSKTRKGRQVVLTGSDYSVRAPIDLASG